MFSMKRPYTVPTCLLIILPVITIPALISAAQEVIPDLKKASWIWTSNQPEMIGEWECHARKVIELPAPPKSAPPKSA